MVFCVRELHTVRLPAAHHAYSQAGASAHICSMTAVRSQAPSKTVLRPSRHPVMKAQRPGRQKGRERDRGGHGHGSQPSPLHRNRRVSIPRTCNLETCLVGVQSARSSSKAHIVIALSFTPRDTALASLPFGGSAYVHRLCTAPRLSEPQHTSHDTRIARSTHTTDTQRHRYTGTRSQTKRSHTHTTVEHTHSLARMEHGGEANGAICSKLSSYS